MVSKMLKLFITITLITCITLCVTGCGNNKLHTEESKHISNTPAGVYEKSINSILIFDKKTYEKDSNADKLYKKNKNIKLNFLIHFQEPGSETLKIKFETDDNIKLKAGNEYIITKVKGKENVLLSVQVEKPFSINGSCKFFLKMDAYDEKGYRKFFNKNPYYYLITDEDISFSNNSVSALEKLHLLNLYEIGKISLEEYNKKLEDVKRK